METPQAFFAPLEGSLEPDRRLPGQSGAGGSDGLLNEARLYHDPTKWLIWSLSKLGLTSSLLRAPNQFTLRQGGSGIWEKQQH